MGEAARDVQSMISPAVYVGELRYAVRENLQESGLSDETIQQAGIRHANPGELPKNNQLVNLDGYAIPFYDVKGNQIKGYVRVRLLHQNLGTDQKYQSPPNSGQHAYLPPMLDPCVWSDTSVEIVITEGEKKALKAVQEGLCCIALTGVSSWHSRTYEVPKSAALESGKKLILHFKEESEINILEHICEELKHIVWAGRPVTICFDTDKKANPQVQQQAFELALWLDSQGAIVRQVYLPAEPGEKVGLDDYLMTHTADDFYALVDSDDSCTFPTMPHIKQWIIRQKQQGKNRKEISAKIARAIVANLDRHGKRFRNREAGEYYYLCDAEDGEINPGLYSFRLTTKAIGNFRNNPIGEVILRDHQLSSGDSDILSDFADRYAMTRPIRDARPRRVCYTKDDAFYFQINDVSLLKVTDEDIREVRNGTDGLLFHSDVVLPLNMESFYSEFGNGYQGRWKRALGDFNIVPQVGLDRRQTELLIAALFHLTPWLRQWRGLMSPVEQVAAEAGSGKTFLYNLRRGILTGKPSLDHITKEPKDWVASATRAPGIWVGDNMNELDYKMRSETGDNIARLVTDPDPHIDARLLFEDNQQARYPVDCSFAVTAIRVPFSKPDIIQRSFIFHMQTIDEGQQNGEWYWQQLAQRDAWVAEHIWVIQQFLIAVKHRWQDNFRSAHRLVHLEQSLYLMLQVLGVDATESLHIVRSMPQTINDEVIQANEAIEVLREFAQAKRKEGTGPFTAKDILDYIRWSDDDFSKVPQFKNAVAFGHWTAQNETVLLRSVGLERYKSGEQVYYRIVKSGTMDEDR